MRSRLLLITIVSFIMLVVLAGSIGCAPKEESGQYRWKAFSYTAAVDSPFYTYFRDFLADLKAKSNGAISVDLFLPGQLPFSAAQSPAALAENSIQIMTGGSLEGLLPEFAVATMPGIVTSYDEGRQLAKALTGDFNEMLVPKNLKILGLAWYGPNFIWSAVPMRSLEDLKGKKIRTAFAAVGEILTKLEAIPTIISTADVVEAVQRGMVAGEVSGVIGAGQSRWMLYKYAYTLAFNQPGNDWDMNLATYNSLPKKLQTLVDELSSEWANKLTDYTEKSEVEYMAGLPAKGVTQVNPTAAEKQKLVEAAREYWSKWAAQSAVQAKLLDKALKALGKS